MLGYVLIKLLAERCKDVKWAPYLISSLFLTKIITDVLHTA